MYLAVSHACPGSMVCPPRKCPLISRGFLPYTINTTSHVSNRLSLHRPSPTIPARNNEHDAIAYFFHPSYHPPHALLFTLPCVDPTNARSANESRRPVGLYHHVALLACQIKADNNFSGRLFYDHKGTRAVTDVVAIEGLLHPGEYFFIVNSDRTSSPLYIFTVSQYQLSSSGG